MSYQTTSLLFFLLLMQVLRDGRGPHFVLAAGVELRVEAEPVARAAAPARQRAPVAAVAADAQAQQLLRLGERQLQRVAV
jgi:hypothetical protein